MLRVIEIIPKTIQGEGTFSGVPCQFIRLAGCNAHCAWCDTKESWRADSGKLMTESEIAHKLSGIKDVCITGGDPLLQDCGTLVWLLKKEGHRVHFEVHSIAEIYKGETRKVPSWLEEAYHVTFCPKPHLRYDRRYLKELSDSGKWVYSLKLVAFPTEECFNEIDEWIEVATKSACFRNTIFIQCGCNDKNEIVDAKKIAEMFIERNYPPQVRLSCQMHKVIGFK